MSTNGYWWTVLGAALVIASGASGQLAFEVAPGGAVPDLSSSSDSPLVAIADPDREHGVELILDLNRFDALLGASAVILRGVPVDKGVTLDLDLKRFEVLSPDARIEVWSEDGREEIERPDIVLLRGTVLGDGDSTAFLALSELGVNGFIETTDQTYIISGGRFGADDDIVAYNLTTLPEGAMNILEFVCRTGELEQPAVKADNAPAGADTRDDVCTVIELAIDTDYEFTNWLFGDSQLAATAYIETLVGATNTIYDRDVNAVFAITYIRLWSDDTDPYFGDSGDYLGVLGVEWTSDPVLMNVNRDLAHVLTPIAGGGGVAWLNAICSVNLGYGASTGINGFFPQPLIQSPQNWDIYIFPHELGHNCGAPHTHDYNPPLDGCGLGDCTNAINGTIMSYCTQCPPGLSNINLEFHPTVQLTIEAFIGNSSCVETASAPVFTLHPASQIACLGDLVSFTSSAFNTGAISYQWYFNGDPIFGATSNSYTIASVNAIHFGDYRIEAGTICDTTSSLVATLFPCAPLPCSPADLTTQGADVGDPDFGVPDGIISGSDISYFVNFWFVGDLGIADLTTQNAPLGDPNFGVPDGLVTAIDLLYYVNLWILDCP